MIRLWILLTVLQTGAGTGGTAQTAALTFPEGATASFESGSIIRIPRTRVIARLEVALSGADTDGRPTLVLDDGALRTQSFSQGDRLILAAQSREPLGLFPRDEHWLQVSRIDTVTRRLGDWRIRRWVDDRQYIEASRATAAGSAPDLELDEPAGGAFILFSPAPRVAIRGRVVSRGDVAVQVGGRLVSLARETASFSTAIDLRPGQREVDITVCDQRSHACRLLLLPIVTSR